MMMGEQTTKFKLLEEFEVKVPRTYNPCVPASEYRARFGGDDRMYKIEEGYTDEAFDRVTWRFVPARFVGAAIFQVTVPVSCEGALAFMAEIGARLVGGPGVLMLWPQAKERLPVVKRVASLDTRGNCPLLGGRAMIPYVFRYSGNDVGFHFDPFDEGLTEKHCLACFWP